MSKIWDTLEYQLSSDEMQSYATNQGNPKIKSQPQEVLDELGLSKVTVLEGKCSDKSKINVEIELALEQSELVPHVFVRVKGPDGKVIKDLTPKGPQSASTPIPDIIVKRKTKNRDSVTLDGKDLLKKIQTFANKYSKNLVSQKKGETEVYFEILQKELHDNLPPAAKLAIQENLHEHLGDGKFLREWFMRNEFKRVPIDLDKMDNLREYVRETNVGRYGHQYGTSVKINWAEKSFSIVSWSHND